MAFNSQIPRSKYIPVESITLSDYSYQYVEVLDHLGAGYNLIFDQDIQFEEFMISESNAGRLDIISWLSYQTVDYWWVIGYFNGIVNPFYELTPGRIIRIPDKSTIDFALQQSVQKDASAVDGQRVIEIP